MPRGPRSIPGHLHAAMREKGTKKTFTPPPKYTLVITGYIKPSGSTGFKKSWRTP